MFSFLYLSSAFVIISHTEEGAMKPWSLYVEEIYMFYYCGFLFCYFPDIVIEGGMNATN